MVKSSDYIVQTYNLTKDYYGTVAVNNINLNIPKSCFALIGPNGAGKTTTILMLLGLIKPTSGNADLFNKRFQLNSKAIKRWIGYLPENIGFFPSLTGWEHIEFYYRLRTSFRIDNKNIENILDWCGLEPVYFHKKVKTYSKGMKQRLGVAQAFIGDPKLVFLDEPLSNIDPIGREDLVNKIAEKRDEGMTIIISSHIIQEIEQIANFISFIDRGRILNQGNFTDLCISYGFNDFEIMFQDSESNPLRNIVLNHEDLLLTKPVFLDNKILIKTDKPKEFEEYLKISDYKSFSFKPLSGSLMKIYKKIYKKGSK